MRSILFVTLFLIAMMNLPTRADHTLSQPLAYCSDGENAFASCSPSNRAFKSVVIAIHGWGGHCDETFGNANTTLFTHLLTNGVSDVDCFEYSTAGQSIETSVSQLRQRLTKLGEDRYSEFVFVTHSMGGIVFLRMMLDDLLNDDKTALRGKDDPKRFFKPDGPQLSFASIWATPINGVTPDIAGAIAFRQWFSSAPAYTKEALIRDKPFLTSLRSDMVKVAALLQQTTPELRGKYSFKLMFHHGQKEDWVVNKIDVDHDAWRIGYKDDRLQVSDIDAGHLDTVGKPGPLELARYPVVMIKSEQLLLLSFVPRLDEAYVADSTTVDGVQQNRRGRIVDGAVLLLSETKDNAIDALRDVLVRMVAADYVHIAGQDEKFAKSLLDAAIEKASRIAGDPNAKKLFVRFADTLLCDGALASFRPDATGPTAVGGDRFVARDLLLNLMRLLAKKMQELVAQDASIGQQLTHCQTIDKLIESAVQPQIQALNANNDSNSLTGVNNLQILVALASPETLDAQAINDAVINFRLRKANGVSEQVNEKLGELIVAASAKSPKQREIAMTRLVLPRVGGSAPFFTKILTDQQLQALNGQIDPLLARQFETDFLSRVIENVGVSSSSATVTLDASDILIDAAEVKTAAEQKQIFDKLDLRKARLKQPRAIKNLGTRIQRMQEP